jgi:putative phosphonate transport system ATP-binding protein
MIAEPVLVVDGLTQRYGTRYACSDVSFEVRPGEVLGIVGESGSGKSTVLSCVHLDQPATAGAIYLAGEDIGRVDAARRRYLRNFRMGMVHQDGRDLDLTVSAGGNVAERLLGADWRHLGQIRARATELLERTEIPAERLDDLTGTYSGGMRQRLALARALANEPALLLLDEPTTGLDVIVQAAILDLIKELHSSLALAMVVVSHDLGVVRLLAERTLVLHQGRVVEAGLTEQVLEDPQHSYTQTLVASSLY